MYSTATYNLTFRKGYNFNAKRFCCSPKQRTFKHDAYTATYDLDNKFQTFGNKTIVYDNDGNMTSGPITEGGNNIDLSFNARGQLIGTGDVAYDYDLEGNRTSLMHYDKNKILTQYRYVYNRVGNVPEVLIRVKLTNMTSQSTYYVYGAGLAYEVKITPDGQEAVRYYHYDQVGSTVAMTDSAQAITDRFHYDPWGYVLHSIGDSDTPFQFVGAYGIQTDPNGLINMRARYYNPVIKSFISQDPSGFEGGLHWYLYANGNPFTYIDKDGEFPVIPILIAAAISGVIDMTITTATDIHNDNFNWESTGAAFLRGFIVGSIAAIATPLSGSVIRSIPSFLNNAGRLTSSGIVARNTLSIGISTAGSGIGQVSYNQLTGRNWDDQLYQAMAFGAIGNSVAYITSRVPKWGNSLLQMNNFGPKTLSTSLTSQNSRYLYNSIVTSSIVSGGLNFGYNAYINSPSSNLFK